MGRSILQLVDKDIIMNHLMDDYILKYPLLQFEPTTDIKNELGKPECTVRLPGADKGNPAKRTPGVGNPEGKLLELPFKHQIVETVEFFLY